MSVNLNLDFADIMASVWMTASDAESELKRAGKLP